SFQHIISDPDGYVLTSYWVQSVVSREDACHGIILTCAHMTGCFLVGINGLAVYRIAGHSEQLVVRSQGDKAHTKDGIRARRIYRHLLTGHANNIHCEFQPL